MSRSLPRRRAIVKLSYACNNGCVFCHSAHLKQLPGVATDDALRRIEEARCMGAESVLFSGGEPTLRRDLPELAEACRDKGMRFGLITNGRMLGYAPLTRRLLEAGLEYAYLSLHGPADVHDSLVRVPGAFGQTVAGARLLSGRGVELTLNAVVVADNLAALPALADLASALPDAKLKFTLVEPKGAALADALHPLPVLAAAAVARALDRAELLGFPRARLGVDGFPHCLDARFAELQDDLHTHGVFAIREVDEPGFFPIDYGNMGRPERCRGCRVSDGCKGTWQGTLQRFGDEWLRPRHGGISNSFNYFPLPVAVERSEADSSLVGLSPPAHADPARLLALRAAGMDTGPSWYATDTGDFSREEILNTRDTLEQVYLQVDDAAMVTDFPRQLRKLVRSRKDGLDGAELPLLRIPLERDVFADAERAVLEVLEGVSGTILDVGCGDLRFLSLLERKLDGGTVRYTAVDPNPGPEVRRLAGEGRVTLIEQPIEALRFERGSFDHVLLLRSHNHLADLWTAYSVLLGALRWQGDLLIVDNVAFGLVRQSGQRTVVDSIPAGPGFEHLRNDDSTDVAERLCRWFPLTVERRRDVTPDSANQWLLLLRKQWPAGGTGRDTYPALLPSPPEPAGGNGQ